MALVTTNFLYSNNDYPPKEVISALYLQERVHRIQWKAVWTCPICSKMYIFLNRFNGGFLNWFLKCSFFVQEKENFVAVEDVIPFQSIVCTGILKDDVIKVDLTFGVGQSSLCPRLKGSCPAFCARSLSLSHAPRDLWNFLGTRLYISCIKWAIYVKGKISEKFIGSLQLTFIYSKMTY